MKMKYSFEKAIYELQNFIGDVEDSGSGFCRAMNELASELPDAPFSHEHLELLLGTNAIDPLTTSTILTKAGHAEILPFVRQLFGGENSLSSKLSYAGMLAQLGDERGEQYLENFFQRFMRKEDGLEHFDLEELVYVFEEIFVNERGQKMLTRFRVEADYHVVWESME